MKIKVKKGSAEIRVELPVFIGTTGKGVRGFPQRFHRVGTSIHGFKLEPEKGDWGTLIFDHPDPAQRTSTSPTFLQFWWDNKGHLQVRDGKNFRAWYKRGMEIDSHWGRSCHDAGILYYTNPTVKGDSIRKRVSLVDHFLFAESKISGEELKARAIEN